MSKLCLFILIELPWSLNWQIILKLSVEQNPSVQTHWLLEFWFKYMHILESDKETISWTASKSPYERRLVDPYFPIQNQFWLVMQSFPEQTLLKLNFKDQGWLCSLEHYTLDWDWKLFLGFWFMLQFWIKIKILLFSQSS